MSTLDDLLMFCYRKSPGYRSTCPNMPAYHVTSKRVTNYHDLLADNCTIFDMLLQLGCKTSLDPGLLVKVIRIGKNFFSEVISFD